MPDINMIDEPWWNVNQAAEYIGLKPSAFLARLRRGRIPEAFFGRLGKAYRFKRSMLDRLIKTKASS